MNRTLLLLIAGLVFSANALAMSLQDAKTQGFVGEQTNGYLGIVKSSPEAQQLIKSVNAKRKAQYQKIATKNGIKTQDVAKLAAEKAIKASKKGHYIQTPSGKWIKK
ncbi:YdbL family protein [Shewanella waksmanii]|uniref:YdbL family protein n=1 Tax=Shewanella waksmanii TaxID=213783 RepID=UPI003734D066